MGSDAPVANHMTANIPATGSTELGRTQQSFSFNVPVPYIGDATAHVTGLATLRWTRNEPNHPSTSLRYGLQLFVTPETPFWTYDLANGLEGLATPARA